MTGARSADPRRLGLAAAVLALAADQGSKLWLLRGFDIAARQPYEVAPGFDLVLAWNRGVSYSLLAQEGETGRYLLIAATALASVALAVWLWRGTGPLTCLALGLLVGGALGNLADRIAYGAVVDFASFHVGSFRWYVFNVADCAITAGVVALLVEWLLPGTRAGLAAPDAPNSPRSSRHG